MAKLRRQSHSSKQVPAHFRQRDRQFCSDCLGLLFVSPRCHSRSPILLMGHAPQVSLTEGRDQLSGVEVWHSNKEGALCAGSFWPQCSCSYFYCFRLRLLPAPVVLIHGVATTAGQTAHGTDSTMVSITVTARCATRRTSPTIGLTDTKQHPKASAPHRYS